MALSKESCKPGGGGGPKHRGTGGRGSEGERAHGGGTRPRSRRARAGRARADGGAADAAVLFTWPCECVKAAPRTPETQASRVSVRNAGRTSLRSIKGRTGELLTEPRTSSWSPAKAFPSSTNALQWCGSRAAISASGLCTCFLNLKLFQNRKLILEKINLLSVPVENPPPPKPSMKHRGLAEGSGPAGLRSAVFRIPRLGAARAARGAQRLLRAGPAPECEADTGEPAPGAATGHPG